MHSELGRQKYSFCKLQYICMHIFMCVTECCHTPLAKTFICSYAPLVILIVHIGSADNEYYFECRRNLNGLFQRSVFP